MTTMTIILEPDLEARLEALAAGTGVDKAKLALAAIVRGIEDIEDFHRADLAMERFLAGEERTYTLDEVSAELGLDDLAA